MVKRKRGIKQKTKNRIMLITIIVLSVLVVFLGAKMFLFNGSENSAELDAFAQCLTDNGMIMYGTEWCSYCKKQKELFGNSFKFVDYVDCDNSGDTCTREGVRGFPTWKINGESYPGVKSLEVLGSLGGCEI